MIKSKQFLVAVLLAGVSMATAQAGGLRLSNIDTNEPGCGYAKSTVSHLAANEGRLPMRYRCINGPVTDPHGTQYAYQLQIEIPDTTPTNQQIELGFINTNHQNCQKPQKEILLLRTPHITFQFQCLTGPFVDPVNGQKYDYQLRTWLHRAP